MLVYDRSDTITGTLTLNICPDAMFGMKAYALIENLIVDPLARGQGVGAALMAYADSLCLERAAPKSCFSAAPSGKGPMPFSSAAASTGRSAKASKNI
ncbi:GNAT family N-acetyltransferase [Paenibacillus sp. P26]|nr:GNAT family N-acetyltransferase [Paenibacillus sp. P26]